MRSMTGFAETQEVGNGFSVSLRIKSVNGRYLDCQFRLPDSFVGLEPQLLAMLKPEVSRGKVTVWMELRIDDPGKAGAHVNTGILSNYATELETLKEQFPMLSFSVPMTVLFNRDANLLVQEQDSGFQDDVKQTVLSGFARLLVSFNGGRKREGDFLQKDFEERLSSLSENLGEVEKQREERVPRLSVNQLAKLAKEEISSMVNQDRIQVLRKLVKRVIVDKDRISATIEGRIPINVVKECKNYAFRSSSRDCRITKCGEEHAV